MDFCLKITTVRMRKHSGLSFTGKHPELSGSDLVFTIFPVFRVLRLFFTRHYGRRDVRIRALEKWDCTLTAIILPIVNTDVLGFICTVNLSVNPILGVGLNVQHLLEATRGCVACLFPKFDTTAMTRDYDLVLYALYHFDSFHEIFPVTFPESILDRPLLFPSVAYSDPAKRDRAHPST